MKPLTILVFLFIQANLIGQVNLASLPYDSEEEKRLLEAYGHDSPFKLLHAIDNPTYDEEKASRLEKGFYAFVEDLEAKIQKKKNKKAIEILYEAIHEQYFSKYIENPNFSDIFSKREYNCVTATALYALALDHLNIPYEIRETVVHVYMIVYPATDKIILESTTPGSKLQHITQKEVEEYKQALISNKMITANELVCITNCRSMLPE